MPNEYQSIVQACRPESLADIVGQDSTIARLQRYLSAPYSAAFLFDGPTGTGKTSAALAIASELGCDGPFGGVMRIAAGEQNGAAVRALRKDLSLVPMMGSGWKVPIVDEADYMKGDAPMVWLSVLEELPPETLIIFTTNDPEKLPDRFLDRCERFHFGGGALELGPACQDLIERICRDNEFPAPPRWQDLPGARVDADGNLSVRRVLQGLESWLREAED